MKQAIRQVEFFCDRPCTKTTGVPHKGREKRRDHIWNVEMHHYYFRSEIDTPKKAFAPTNQEGEE